MVGARGRIWGAQRALGVTASVLRAVTKHGLRGGNEGHRRQCYDGNINNSGEPPRRRSVETFLPFLLQTAHVYCVAGERHGVHRCSRHTVLDVVRKRIVIGINNVYCRASFCVE